MSNTDEFIICPDCGGESNTNPNVKCGTCGCAGVIPNPNFPKEEEMNNHKCYAITKKHRKCEKLDTEQLQVLVKGGQAIIPATKVSVNNMPGYFTVEEYFCGTHRKMLEAGRKIDVQNYKIPNTKEEEMKNNEEQYDGPSWGDILPGGARMSEFAYEETLEDFVDDHDPIHPEDFYNGDLEFPDECEDAEKNMADAIKEMHGRPYRIDTLRYGGHLVVEECGHQDCDAIQSECGHEANREICCGASGDDCPHYTAWTCLHHPDITKIPGAVKHSLPQLTRNEGQAKQYHKTMQQVGAHIDMLKRNNFTGVKFYETKNHAEKGFGYWVYWMYEQPKGRVQKATFKDAKPHRVKCGNCQKNGVEDPYHDSVAEVKHCYASK